ncbi:sulfotransferase family protein [Aspergillus neoniger CBS 115656]|uniref:NAD dependent epimerase/dehydratase n=1 Tax=Aspergillus neoniger (strain CBS 115656) TaxID=1448310 RepID=A0A318YVF3_ASPNB|nr:NAD dependent epimerase/dehydratase [Aspergillus neoniger CBS 115656]PYH31858.1 NAD dependent epimerase/dehydratase [Aspergillus neoniger CBS 115656]
MTTYQFHDVIKSVTDIDRRKCRREVPMQVLALGLCRTGTDSLRQALRALGYNDTYHGYAAVLENPRDCEMWLAALSAKYEGKGRPFGREEFDQILGHCQAVSDFPAACFADELIQTYPEAKVILTVRDVDDWHSKSFTPLLTHPFLPLSTILENFLLSRTRWVLPTWQKIWKYYFNDNFDANGRKAFEAHNSHVKDIVPAENLLVYHVKDGWEPLCEFLGKKPPLDGNGGVVPFPRGNDPGIFRNRFRDAIWYNFLELGERVLRVIVVLYFGYLWVGWVWGWMVRS